MYMYIVFYQCMLQPTCVGWPRPIQVKYVHVFAIIHVHTCIRSFLGQLFSLLSEQIPWPLSFTMKKQYIIYYPSVHVYNIMYMYMYVHVCMYMLSC